MFHSQNMIVLDLETARSANDCRHCGFDEDTHFLASKPLLGDHVCEFEPIGWDNRPALGLSIGCYYSYVDDRMHWFDDRNLEETMESLVAEQPLMVSFNGIAFDFVLMRGVLRRRAEHAPDIVDQQYLPALCNQFKALAASSYDILAQIWKADSARKFERGLNSLDAIAQANGLGPKLSHGAQAPRDWQAGNHADVINYCQDDVLKTKELLEIIYRDDGVLKRGDGSKIVVYMHTNFLDENEKTV